MGAVKLNFLLIIFITTILLAAQPIGAKSGNHPISEFDQFIALRQDSRTRKVTNELKANPHAEFRFVVPNKCEIQGEIELRKLALTKPIEESYAFIPSLCLWIEVGYDEARTRARLDAKFISRLIESFDRLILYHIHVGDSSEFTGNFPAYRDFISLILVNAEYFRRPEIQISHRAITKIGVIDYRFRISPEADRLIDKINQAGLGKSLAQNLAYYFSQEKYVKRYYAKVDQCMHFISGNIENLADCFPIKTDNFELLYRTFGTVSTAGFYE